LREVEGIAAAGFFKAEPSWLPSVVLAGCPNEYLHSAGLHVYDLEHFPTRADDERECILIESWKWVEPKLLPVSHVCLHYTLRDFSVRSKQTVFWLDIHEHFSGGILKTGINDFFLNAN